MYKKIYQCDTIWALLAYLDTNRKKAVIGFISHLVI